MKNHISKDPAQHFKNKSQFSRLGSKSAGIFCGMIAAWLACASALAQKPQLIRPKNPSQEAVIRISVNLVQVDAVVTDSKGKAVTNLEAENFIILQDGEPQEITHFTFVRTKDPVIRSVVEADRPVSAEDDIPAPHLPPIPLKPEKIRRTIVLVVDDLGLSFECTTRTREAILKWIDNEMQPDDLVAIMMTGKEVGALQQFTNDKQILRAAVNGIHFNMMSRVGVSSFEPITDPEKAII